MERKDLEYGDYNADNIALARQRLEEAAARKPEAYKGRFQTQLEGTMQKILNREPFSV